MAASVRCTAISTHSDDTRTTIALHDAFRTTADRLSASGFNTPLDQLFLCATCSDHTRVDLVRKISEAVSANGEFRDAMYSTPDETQETNAAAMKRDFEGVDFYASPSLSEYVNEPYTANICSTTADCALAVAFYQTYACNLEAEHLNVLCQSAKSFNDQFFPFKFHTCLFAYIVDRDPTLIADGAFKSRKFLRELKKILSDFSEDSRATGRAIVDYCCGASPTELFDTLVAELKQEASQPEGAPTIDVDQTKGKEPEPDVLEVEKPLFEDRSDKDKSKKKKREREREEALEEPAEQVDETPTAEEKLPEAGEKVEEPPLKKSAKEKKDKKVKKEKK